MPPHRFNRARWLCGMPLWQTFYPQVDCARPPGSSEELGSGPQQPPVQATLSLFAHLSKDLHLSLSKIGNRELALRAKMSCRLLRRQEMPFLSRSIFPASGLYVPPCRSNRAGLSWMRGVAMHRMQLRNYPIVLQPGLFLAEPTPRFSRSLPDFALSSCVTKQTVNGERNINGQVLRFQKRIQLVNTVRSRDQPRFQPISPASPRAALGSTPKFAALHYFNLDFHRADAAD